ncbi:MAG: hypothetical protein KDC27_01220 [Acidobacteria bacterium]|nr:hypothetical protein [Acidobacteriota bacterium]
MLNRFRIQRAAACALALTLFSLGASAQRIARSRSAEPALAVEASARFFPLAEGNSWTYNLDRLGPEEGVTVSVGAPVEMHGVAYFPVRGFAGDEVLLRADANGRVLEYLADEGREALLYDFSLPVGGTWAPRTADGCTGPATVAARNEPESTQAGAFRETVTIEYAPGACADAGVGEEVFAAGIGLVRRTETMIAGPRSMRLARARVGGRTIESAGLSFSVKIDRPRYVHGADGAAATLRTTVTAENSSDVPLTLAFPSPQLFDLSIRNEKGETVYTWSANKLFPAVVTEISLGRRVLETEIPLEISGRPLPDGLYTLEAWMTQPQGQLFSGSVPFTIASGGTE